MNFSENRLEITKALIKAWGELETVKKESLNPAFRSKYSDLASILDVVRPTLAKNGLALLTPIRTDETKLYAEALLLHESGEFAATEVGFTLLDHKPQTVGSVATYARRYAVMALLNLASDDDDGNAASGRPALQGQGSARAPYTEAARPQPAPANASVASSTELRDKAIAQLITDLSAETVTHGALAAAKEKAETIKKTWPETKDLPTWQVAVTSFSAHAKKLTAAPSPAPIPDAEK